MCVVHDMKNPGENPFQQHRFSAPFPDRVRLGFSSLRFALAFLAMRVSGECENGNRN